MSTGVWITKYACARGIIRAEASISEGGDLATIGGRFKAVYRKGEWFYTREAAARDAEDRRQRKILSLRRSITKLEEMDFLRDSPGVVVEDDLLTAGWCESGAKEGGQ